MNLRNVNNPGDVVRYQRGTLSHQQIASITRINHYTYTILDSKLASKYVIHMHGEYGDCAVDCSCPIYCNRPDMACKHMIAIERWITDLYARQEHD